MTEDYQSFKDLTKEHENEELEFKRAFRWNHYTGKIEKTMSKNITKVISSFLNTDGGKLIIGIDDDGHIVGVEKDIFSYSPNDYQKGKDLFLTDIGEKIRKNIGVTANFNCRATFIATQDQEILIISVVKSKRPYFHLKNDFYIRSKNTTIKLSREETYEYFKNKFNVDLSKRNLESIIFNIIGFGRLFKNLIQEKKEYYLSLFIILIIYYLIWYINLFLDYNSSIRFFPFQFMLLSLILLMIIFDLLKQYKSSNSYEKNKPNKFLKYIPEIKLWLVIIAIISFSLCIFFSLLSVFLLLPMFKSNIKEFLTFLFQIIMILIVFAILYRERKKFPKSLSNLLKIDDKLKNKDNNT